MSYFPKAETFARDMSLPLAVNRTVLELYGYRSFVLDVARARATLQRAGFRGAALFAAMDVLYCRADAMGY